MKFLRDLFRKAIPEPRLGPLAQALMKAMHQPGWTLNTHTFDHKDFKLRLWVSNGPKYFRIYHINDAAVPEDAPGFALTPEEQFVLWHRYTLMQQEAAVVTLENLMAVVDFKDAQ